MKLEVGMLIRDEYGNIGKIVNINNYRDPKMKYAIDYQRFSDVIFIGDMNIKITSHNIIDLIEVGDYVNGYQVTSKDQFLGFGNHDWYMLDNEIKSIVTKEQFESMKYTIDD